METNSISLEKELMKLTPAVMPASMLDRLDEAILEATQEVTVQDEDLLPTEMGLSSLEESLVGLVPYGVPEDMISRLDEAMSRWHEEVPVEEKVVPLHSRATKEKSSWFGFRSAAAVAVLGAGAALLPSGDVVEADVTAQRIPVLTNGKTAPVVFTPKDANASVVATNDHGVVWTKNGQALRCLEVCVKNEVQFVNGCGEQLIIEQPQWEVRFTPVEVD